LFARLKQSALAHALHRRFTGQVPFRPIRDMAAMFRFFVRTGIDCVRRYFPRFFAFLKNNRLVMFFYRRLFHPQVPLCGTPRKQGSHFVTWRPMNLEAMFITAAEKWPLGKRIHD